MSTTTPAWAVLAEAWGHRDTNPQASLTPKEKAARTVLVKRIRANVPRELRALPVWLLWDSRKAPVYADGTSRRGTLDAPQDRDRLVTFDTAALALLRVPRACGLGVALGAIADRGITLAGIDLDHCRTKDRLDPRANEIVRSARSYAESSPSGTGVHILGLGDIGTTKKGTGLEIYSGKRFFTVTGQPIRKHGLTDLRAVADLARRLFQAPPAKPSFNGPSKRVSVRQQRQALVHFEALLKVFRGLDMLIKQRGDKFDVRCPWFHEHSDGDVSGSALLAPSEANNWSGGYFCAHSHCAGRDMRAIRAWHLELTRRAWATLLNEDRAI